MVGVFPCTSESLGVKLLRVFPGIGIMMQGIYGKHNLGSSRNMDSVKVKIFMAFTVDMDRGRAQALGLLYKTVEVVDILDNIVKTSLLCVGLQGLSDLCSQFLLHCWVHNQVVQSESQCVA